jgi:hypothetical protein
MFHLLHTSPAQKPGGLAEWYGTRLENGQTERFWGFESLTLLSEQGSRRKRIAACERRRAVQRTGKWQEMRTPGLLIH